MRGQQTACGREDGALTVALDGATLKHKIETVDIVARDDTLLIESGVDGIVLFGGEFLTPAIETEVDQPTMTLVIDEGDEAMVACPSVVGRDIIPLLSYNQQRFAPTDLTGHLLIGSRNLLQHRCPISMLVRPGQLHTHLRFPFCR